jgi:hypothetical protein
MLIVTDYVVPVAAQIGTRVDGLDDVSGDLVGEDAGSLTEVMEGFPNHPVQVQSGQRQHDCGDKEKNRDSEARPNG